MKRLIAVTAAILGAGALTAPAANAASTRVPPTAYAPPAAHKCTTTYGFRPAVAHQWPAETGEAVRCNFTSPRLVVTLAGGREKVVNWGTGTGSSFFGTTRVPGVLSNMPDSQVDVAVPGHVPFSYLPRVTVRAVA